MKVAVYCRVASSDLSGDLSLARQEQACREYVERRGWELNMVYTDSGQSGTNLDRPGWRRLLDVASSGAFDAVLATDPDRFGRTAGVAATAFAALDDLGISTVTVDGQVDRPI